MRLLTENTDTEKINMINSKLMLLSQFNLFEVEEI